MRKNTGFVLLLLCLILMTVGYAHAATNVVAREGTVFLGEKGLDLSQTAVSTGTEIAWWSGGSPSGMPQERYKVMDSKRFDVSYPVFEGKTGSWYTLEGKNLAFIIEEPFFSIEIQESGWDWEKDWIKRGSLITFSIKSNLITAIANRPTSNSVPVTIIVTGPDGVEYSKLKPSKDDTYALENILAYYDPFSTGVVWDTGLPDYPDGTYTIRAYTNVNGIDEQAPADGMTRTEPQTFILQDKNPAEKTPKPTKSSDKRKKDAESDSADTTDNIQGEDESGEEKPENGTSSGSDLTPTPEVTKTPDPTPIPTPEVKATLVAKTTISPPHTLPAWTPRSRDVTSPPTQASPLPLLSACLAIMGAMAILARRQ